MQDICWEDGLLYCFQAFPLRVYHQHLAPVSWLGIALLSQREEGMAPGLVEHPSTRCQFGLFPTLVGIPKAGLLDTCASVEEGDALLLHCRDNP